MNFEQTLKAITNNLFFQIDKKVSKTILLTVRCHFVAHIMKFWIHEAVYHEDCVDLKRALREHDAHRSINAPCPDHSYYSPLHLACEIGNYETVRLLLKSGCDVHQKLPVEAAFDGYLDYRFSPIHFAAESKTDNVGILDLLVRHGADINHCLLDGSTPLHIAVVNKNERIVQALLKKGARVNLRHGKGQTTALDDSYRVGNELITEQLVNRCQLCGRCATWTRRLKSCICDRVKYCSEECKQADHIDHGEFCEKVCTWISPRFRVGERVRCVVNCGETNVDSFRDGIILRQWYVQDNFSDGFIAPYQVRLDDGRLIYAPYDTNAHIQFNDGKGDKLTTLRSFQLAKAIFKSMKRKELKKVCHVFGEWNLNVEL